MTARSILSQMSHLTRMNFRYRFDLSRTLNSKPSPQNATFDWDDFRVKYFLMNFPLTFLHMIYFQDFNSFSLT